MRRDEAQQQSIQERRRVAIQGGQPRRVQRATPAQAGDLRQEWLARVDEHGGSIFAWRPRSNGAEDMAALTAEVLTLFQPAGKRRKTPVSPGL